MRPKSHLSFILILLTGLAVILLNMTFAGKISGIALMSVRLSLVALFSIAWYFFRQKENLDIARLAITFAIVNLAFFVVSFFTTQLWGLDLGTARGIALIKFSDGLVISVVLTGCLFVAGFKPHNLFIKRGRLLLGLATGTGTFLIFGALSFLSAESPIELSFIKDNIGWVLLFVFSNAIMEELLFRGIFIEPLDNLLTPIGTVVVTSIIFSAAHLQVSYTPDILVFAIITFVLGLIWAWLIRYTNSIIASVMFHAGADLMIIFPIYQSLGTN